MNNKVKFFKKGFKFPIYPTAEQKELLEKSFGCCRFVWNKTLAEVKLEYQQYRENKQLIRQRYNGYSFCSKIPIYKTTFLWLGDVDYNILQQSLLHLGSAFTKFFKAKQGYPKFKKKTNKQSFALTRNSFKLKDDQLYLAKSKEPLAVGYGRKNHIRELPSYPTSATISKTPTGKYHISFICEYTPEKTSGMEVTGLDMGIKDFLTKSDGTKVVNPKYLRKLKKQLRRTQQALSKKKKGSINYNKARLKVANIHERITNLRTNFQHQLSRQLVNDNQVIGIETLRVANMVKNRCLAKSISDVSWSSFFSKLIYKSQESQHCNVVKIDAFYPSSHICSKTKEKLDHKLSLKERSWNCPYCGKTHDRDVNAAINIRDKAMEIVQNLTKLNGIQPYGQLILA